MAKRATVDLQLRGVPVSLRDAVRRRARGKGVSMSRYVIEVIKDDIERPASLKEWLDEVAQDPPVPGVSGGAIVRELRDELEEGIED